MRILFLLVSIILFASCNSNKAEKCFYYEKGKRYDLKEKDNCITLSHENILLGTKENDAFIDKSVIESAYYNQYNLGELFSKFGFFYFTKQGKVRQVLGFDNGADYFKNGLARTINKNNKIGFFDTNLTIIIKPMYDFAFPFENKIAIVCNGCKKIQVGEHSSLDGGKWGAIDSKGIIIKPLEYSSFREIYSILNFKGK